jgi:thermitase
MMRLIVRPGAARRTVTSLGTRRDEMCGSTVARTRWAALAGVIAMALLAGTWRTGDDSEPATLVVGVHSVEDQDQFAPVLRFFGAFIREDLPSLRVLRVDTRPGTRGAVMSHLRRDPRVRYVEVDAPFTMEPMGMPADPMVKDQWALSRIRAPESWELLPPGGKTIVAVLDTGIDFTHPDLAGVISPDACNAQADRCPTPAGFPRTPDVNGHGTHVAGIIGAIPNNDLGIAGAAGGRVTLLPITLGFRGQVNMWAYLNAVTYAVDRGARVINMSFGDVCGSHYYEAYRDAVDYAESRGVLIVASAGNFGPCLSGRYPQDDPRVLSVAASDAGDAIPAWSGVGHYVSVVAPGVSVLSTVPMMKGGYRNYSGTSMAAPHVAAQAALLFQVPGATKAKVMDWIKSTCDPINVSAQCGGRINFYRSIYLAMFGTDPGPGRGEAPAPRIPAATAAPDGDQL